MRGLGFRSKEISWGLRIVDGLETDEYDQPDTVYFLKRDANLNPIGVSRLYRTDKTYEFEGQQVTYLLADLVSDQSPHLLYENTVLPYGPNIWEAGRMCVDPKFLGDGHRDLRRSIVSEIVVAILQYCSWTNIDHILGVMDPPLWNSVWIERGVEQNWLGPACKLSDGEIYRAASFHYSPDTLQRVRNITNINYDVLELP